jgi:P-type E1-E2 ATPase
MIGDGTNDAEALSAATVGLAVGTGTSLAQGAAGLVLLDPSPVVWQRALALGAEARSAVRRNLAWAAGYNLMALPLAAGVWVPWGGPDLHPMVASGLMALSSLGVVAATAWALTRRREHDVDPAN